MAVARNLVYCFVGITIGSIFSHVFLVDACATTLSVDEVTLRGETTAATTLAPGETVGTTAVTVGPDSCVVGNKPFGTFSPAPGSIVADGDTVALTCDAKTAHKPANGGTFVATCNNGVLSPTSPCLPCPDATWLFDSTTTRCFKAFPGPMPAGPCDITAICQGVGAPYGVPSDIAYTLNLPILFDAGDLAYKANPLPEPAPFWYIGMNDAAVDRSYKLKDGTPVPRSVLTPIAIPTFEGPGSATVSFTEMRLAFGSYGLDDDPCLTPFGSICQLQL